VSQLGMFRDARCDEWWQRVLVEIRRAVDVITIKELAHALDVAPSYVVDALKGTERKGVKAEWLPVILMMSPSPQRQALLEALSIPAGYVVQQRRQLTPEERLAALEQRVAQRFGVAGAELLKEVP
jgi:hypothetical protein